MTASPSTTSTTSKAVKATTTRRPRKAPEPSMTGKRDVKVTIPEVVRFKANLTKTEQANLEASLTAATSASGDLMLSITGLAVALTYALGASWAEANLTGSLRSWALTGVAIVKKAGITTSADPQFAHIPLIAERRGVESITAMTPTKVRAALTALSAEKDGKALTVKAKQAVIKDTMPTTKRGTTKSNAKSVKVEQVASRITRLHESLPDSVTGDESGVKDLRVVLARLVKDVERLASTAKAPAVKGGK